MLNISLRILMSKQMKTPKSHPEKSVVYRLVPTEGALSCLPCEEIEDLG